MFKCGGGSISSFSRLSTRLRKVEHDAIVDSDQSVRSSDVAALRVVGTSH
jgi:hypothetical protein